MTKTNWQSRNDKENQILIYVCIIMKVVILENIRSAYNVGNIIRTADALGWKVWLT
jgi:tRNA G18 (ribose-2'-O)-methylase SpoU